MPDVSGFWTAEERDAYNQSGAIPGQESSSFDNPYGGMSEDQITKLFGTQTYTDPTGAAVLGNVGSWQGTPGSPLQSVWVPGAPGQNNPQAMADLYQNIDPALGQFMAGQSPAQFQIAGTPPTSPIGPMVTTPPRARAQGSYQSPAGVAGFQPYQDFMTWWNQGRGEPFIPGSAMMDYTGLAPFDPVTGQNLGGITDIGALYNRYGVLTPATQGPGGSRGNQLYLPDMLGWSFSRELMQGNPGLFIAGLQANQLEQGQQPTGPIHPWVPPQAGGGFPPGAVMGGAYGTGQSMVAGHQIPGLPWYGQPAAGQPGGYRFPLYPGGPGGSGSSGVQPPPAPGAGPAGAPAAPVATPPPGGSNVPGSPFGGAPIGPGGQSSVPISPGSETGGPDQWLANLAGSNMGYLQGIAQNAGYATDATPAWQAMVAAQQRNLDRRFADLTESMNVSGNRFSTAFGTAATDFWNQAGLDQNALLLQGVLQSQEQARQRELQAAGQLGQFSYGAGQQLAGQDFQSRMQQQQQAFQAAQLLYGGGQQAAAQLAGLGAQGAQGLLGGSIAGAQGLFGAQNQAAMNEVQRQLLLQQMGLGAAGDLSRLWQSNLGLGSQLGGQQYALQQNQLQQAYAEWLRTQPYNNPLLPYMYAAGTAQQPQYFPQYRPPLWSQILGAGMGAAGSIFGGAFGG